LWPWKSDIQLRQQEDIIIKGKHITQNDAASARLQWQEVKGGNITLQTPSADTSPCKHHQLTHHPANTIS
jgi:hypothetical protein